MTYVSLNLHTVTSLEQVPPHDTYQGHRPPKRPFHSGHQSTQQRILDEIVIIVIVFFIAQLLLQQQNKS
jgi:hypothetical protein